MHRDVFDMSKKCRVCHHLIADGEMWYVQMSSGRAKSYRWKTPQKWEVHMECAMEVVLYVP